MAFNPAAVASRGRIQSRRFAGDFATDVSGPGLELSFLVKSVTIPVGGRHTFDATQRGTSGRGSSLAGSALFARTGWGVIASNTIYATSKSQLDTSFVGAVVGHGFVDGQLAIGIEGSAALSTLFEEYENGRYGFHYFDGHSARIGAIVRPRNRSFRAGASFRPESTLRARQAMNEWDPDSIHIPWQASIGFASAVGNLDFNRPGWTLADGAQAGGEGRFLVVSTDLVAVGPSGSAASFESVETGAPKRLGAPLTLSPRVGAESELFPRRFRARIGAYLEPARGARQDRLHGTAGYDLRLGKLGPEWKMTAAIDVAREYQAASIAFGIWK